MISLFVTWWVSYESDLSLHGSIVLAPSFQSMSPVLLCSCGWCPFISRNYFTVDHIRRGSRSREGTDNKQYLLLQLSLRYDTYTLFDGFTDNTRGYFTSYVVFFRAPQGRGKMREMSKMPASIICNTIE